MNIIKDLYVGAGAWLKDWGKATEEEVHSAGEIVLEPVPESVLAELVAVQEISELRELRDLISAMFKAGEVQDPVKYISLNFNPKLPHPQEAPNVVRMREIVFPV